MKTEISEYCQEYADVLRPLSTSLQVTIQCVDKESSDQVLNRSLAGLNDVAHRLKTLVDKILNQQTYLLIFGPLKSGKSTLMNAISRTYVSEVSSLPAYPCLVHVRHNEKKHFSITRYNGKTLLFPNNAAVQTLITDSHGALAARIREVESDGRQFEPGIDYPEAIRRIDIQFPIDNLKQSGAVLVDTPGLYSRMKFGYDLMTREFRNSAACAVFVVKTDNLFLEQVFEEFNQLLDLFSRIFLIVNLDTGKRDLCADGALRPSLESSAPDRIIEAYETLSMSEPLRKAREEGRLRIYPVDLLSEASRHLLEPLDQVASSPDPKAPESEAAEARPDGDAAEPTPTPSHSMEEFLRDLTDYLNSNDYLVEFMRDGLRQGKILCQDACLQCEPEHLTEFKLQQARLAQRQQDLQARQTAVEELLAANLKTAFTTTIEENERQANRLAGELKSKVALDMGRALDQWFESSESLHDLEKRRWNPILEQVGGTVAQDTLSHVKSLVQRPSGGAEFPPGLTPCLKTLNISLPEISQSAAASLESSAPGQGFGLRLDPALIPVRKSFWDWIFFRNQAAVRRRVFGPLDEPNREISAAAKIKRLGGEGKDSCTQVMNAHLQAMFPGNLRRCAESLLDQYIGRFCEDLRAQVEVIGAATQDECRQVEEQIAANERILSALDDLKDRLGGIERQIESLRQRYAGAVVEDYARIPLSV